MKLKIFNKLRLTQFVVFSAAIVAFSACRKVDNHYKEVANTPFAEAEYGQTALVGDTVTIRGKLFINEGGYVQAGAVKAVLVNKKVSVGADGVEQDEVGFALTKDIGIGAVAIKVVTKGVTLNLPSITIRQYAGIPQHTDTTLYVEQLAQFTPANLNIFQTNYLNLLVNSSIDANGNIWFDNSLGIYKVTGAVTAEILHAGSTLTDDSGPFIINRILGSVISYDGTTLTFSADIRDNADTVANYVFKLCQLNLITNKVTTLNRSMVGKSIAKIDGSPGAFEGPIAQLKIVAMSLRTDANNVLYFNNNYQVPSPNADPVFWYGQVSMSTNVFGPYVIENICKMNGGMVSSLFSMNNPYAPLNSIFKAPGYPVVITSDYKISEDGSTAYVYDQTDGANGYSILQYDLKNKLPLHSSGLYASYRILYDPATNTLPSSFVTYLSFQVTPNGDYSLFPLPNGTILLGSGASIAAVNNLDLTAYVFAGSENGLNGAPDSTQTQTTGKAKNVVFNNANAANLYFCGIDKTGAVYYITSATGADLKSAPLTFYKIYPKH